MSHRKAWRSVLFIALAVGMISIAPSRSARGDDAASREAEKQRAKLHWENIVQWFGDEETGEWSLRIRDADVHERGWFEYLELWQFDRKEHRWTQIKTEKFGKPIVLPKQKGSDEPEKEQTLVDLKEIEPKTAGIWYAKWKIDDIECGTLMRVGTSRTSNVVDVVVPDGMLKMPVPISLDKSELMLVPDPRLYCIAGGPGKPDGRIPAKRAEKPAGKDDAK